MECPRVAGKQGPGRKDTHSMETQKRCSGISLVVIIHSKVKKSETRVQHIYCEILRESKH